MWISIDIYSTTLCLFHRGAQTRRRRAERGQKKGEHRARSQAHGDEQQVGPFSYHRRTRKLTQRLAETLRRGERDTRLVMVRTSRANPALALLLLLSSPSFAFPHFPWPRLWAPNTRISKRTVPAEGYYSPLANGGSLLTVRAVLSKHSYRLAGLTS